MKKLITKVSNYINRDNFLEKGKFARVPDFSKLTLHPYPLMFYFRTHVQLPDSSQANSPPKHYTQHHNQKMETHGKSIIQNGM